LQISMMQASPVIPVLTGRSVRARRAGPFEVSLVEHRGDVSLTRHRHAEAVIGLLLRGNYDEWMDGRTVEPGRASLLIKPPETPHANRIGRTGTHTVLIQVRPESITPDLAPVLTRPAIHVDARIHGIGELILSELKRGGPRDSASLEALIVELLQVAERRGARRGAGYSHRQRWVVRARDFLRAHAHESCTLDEVACAAGVDRAHLARTFRMVFGCTLGEYVRAARVERAETHLREGSKPLTRIALDSGFADQAHFTRTFRDAFGATPARYRRSAAR
jgi:AraC family transcriptional regulator